MATGFKCFSGGLRMDIALYEKKENRYPSYANGFNLTKTVRQGSRYINNIYKEV